MMSDIHGITRASGLTYDEHVELEQLVRVFGRMRGRNAMLEHYYEGDVMARDIGVKMLPENATISVDLSCDWARKAVNALADLVRFDGFVFEGIDEDAATSRIMRDGFGAVFARARIGILKNGCAFVTVGGTMGRSFVRVHGANDGAGIMDPTSDRLRSGFVIAESARTAWSRKNIVPTRVNLYMPGSRVSLVRDGATEWHAERFETPEGVMMMVPMCFAPTDTKPLGSTRITRQVRDLVDDVLRVRLALVMSTAFYAVPMRVFLGLTDDQYEAMLESKWGAMLNPFSLLTKDEDSDIPNPTPYQFPSNSPQPLIDLIQNDAKLFASATGIPLNSLGVVQDNPSSAEAIAEARKDLTDTAQSLIDGQLTPALREVALLAMMVEGNVETAEGLTKEQQTVLPHFVNPAMPSISASTDAAMKIASVNPAFAQTDEFFRMVGFDVPTINRVNRQMRLNAARANGSSFIREQEPQQANGFQLATNEGATDED